MKSAEEILEPYLERPFRHTTLISKENAIKAMKIYSDQVQKNGKNSIQIDVRGALKDQPDVFRCNLYTSERDVTVFMHKNDYESLMQDGFFIRDGKSKDSANVLNTTNMFYEETR